VTVALQNVGRSSDDQQAGSGEPECAGARYKKVAVVEDFFDIIYNVHVEMDGRGGKHAGQKRTYRAVSISRRLRTALWPACGKSLSVTLTSRLYQTVGLLCESMAGWLAGRKECHFVDY